MEQRFEFAFDPRYRPLLALMGIRPDNSEVVLTDERFVAHFGRMRISTRFSNIEGTQTSGSYRAIKAIGIRASLADWGATFGTNTDAGLCVCFREPVKGLFGGFKRHPGLTVTVADVEGLRAAIEDRIA